MPSYTVTYPVTPSGVISAQVRAANPQDAVREANKGTFSLDPEFAAEGYQINLSAEPEVWEVKPFGRSRHVSGPQYDG
jgi:hypothetical protein